MDRFRLLVEIRKQIISVISGVEDARGNIYWDDTRPNWLTKHDIQNLFDFVITSSEKFGISISARHSNCRSKYHVEDYMRENFSEYIQSNFNTKEIVVYDVLSQG